MINKQSWIDHIRQLRSEGDHKEAERLTQVLARDIKAGMGTTGDPVLDAKIVERGELDVKTD